MGSDMELKIIDLASIYLSDNRINCLMEGYSAVQLGFLTE
jgi:hypothetical protein